MVLSENLSCQLFKLDTVVTRKGVKQISAIVFAASGPSAILVTQTTLHVSCELNGRVLCNRLRRNGTSMPRLFPVKRPTQAPKLNNLSKTPKIGYRYVADSTNHACNR